MEGGDFVGGIGGGDEAGDFFEIHDGADDAGEDESIAGADDGGGVDGGDDLAVAIDFDEEEAGELSEAGIGDGLAVEPAGGLDEHFDEVFAA